MNISEKHYRSILLYAVFGALAVGVAFTGAGLVVLREHYQGHDEATLSLALNTRVGAVEQFLTRAGDICLQVTSRTVIRNYLEDYNRGKVSLAQLVQFTAPKLDDAMHLSEDVVGISRFDANGHLVVQIGLVIPGASFPVPAASDKKAFFQEPVVFADEIYLPIFGPIINRDGARVGTDLLFFRTKALQEILADRSGLGESGEIVLAVSMNGAVRRMFPGQQKTEVSAVLPKAGRLASALAQAIAGKKSILLPVGKERDFIAFAPISAEGWGLAVRIGDADLQAPEKRAVWMLGVVAALITGSGIALMILLLRPLTGALQKELSERRTREKELHLFRKQLDRSNDAIFIVSPVEGRFLDVNDTAHVMLGYTREELLAMRVADVDTGLSTPAKWQEFVRKIRELPERLLVTDLRRKNSTTVPVEITIKYLSQENNDCLIAIARNISERKDAENLLRTKVEQLAALNSLAAKISASLSLAELAEASLPELVSITGADFAILYILRNGELLPVKSHSRSPFLRKNDNQPHKVGSCLCGLAANGKPVYSSNIHNDPNCTMRECKDAGLRSFAALPMRKGKTIVGVLGIATLTERQFSAEADFLEALAGQAAIGVQNALLYDQLNEHAAHLDVLVKERTADLRGRNEELERLNRLFVDREFRIKELRDQVVELQMEKVAR